MSAKKMESLTPMEVHTILRASDAESDETFDPDNLERTDEDDSSDYNNDSTCPESSTSKPRIHDQHIKSEVKGAQNRENLNKVVMAVKRSFRDAWLDIEDFQPWLCCVEDNPSRAFCNICKREVSAELTAIKRHKTSKMHAVYEASEQQERIPVHHGKYAANGVAVATILFACFIAEHNLPFTTADHLVDLMKRMFPDSVIAQGMNMKRTKCTEVVRTLGRCVTEDLVDKLRENKFSIIVDKTTDISTMKAYSVLVRFWDSTTISIKSGLLELINVYGDELSTGLTGKNLYNLIMKTLETHRIPHGNLIGFAADGASNIMGEHNSISSRLCITIPGITILKCICHSIHLCTSEAAKTLPRRCEDMIRLIYTYFSHSAKRQHEFKEFQSFCTVKPHKVLHVNQTRWLSFHQAVERVLEQWQPLKMFFTLKESEERLMAVQQIAESFRDPSLLLYYNFLNFILPKCNKLNLLFQSESPTIHLLHDSICQLYRNLLGYFCRPEVFQTGNLDAVDPRDDENHLPISQIYLGATIHGLLQSEQYREHSNAVKDVQFRCRIFMINLCVQLRQRFELGSKFLWMCSFLSSNRVFDTKSRKEMPSLYDFVKAVPRIYSGSIQVLDDQWRDLDVIAIPPEIKDSSDIVDVYTKLGELKDGVGVSQFKDLCTFALQVLSLPTSNADAERLFSKFNLMKTKSRNTLQTPSINSLIALSEAVKFQGGCINFTPNQRMLTSV
ncbi:protein ZBED8-like isoform X2 [Homarus americanus]|nr:protein ZBED8-like isoform X2 [Homarus americanus]